MDSEKEALPSIHLSSPTPDASPEEVRLAVVAALQQLRSVRVQAEVTEEGAGGTERTRAVQLLDRKNHLARETVSVGGTTVQDRSIVGNRELAITFDGEERAMVERVALAPREDLLPTLYALDPELLEKARATKATRQPDGSWELEMEPYTPPELAGYAASGEIRLQTYPNLLPLEVEYTQDLGELAEGAGSSAEGVQPMGGKLVYRMTYSFEEMPELTEDDVRLKVPEGQKVTDRLLELPLDDLELDLPFPQYWLGRQVLGRSLAKAGLAISHPDSPNQEERITLSYAPAGMSTGRGSQEPDAKLLEFTEMARNSPDAEELLSAAQYGPATSIAERNVAGRKGRVHTSITPAGLLAGFVVVVEFPDALVQVKGPGGQQEVESVLEALRPLESS